MKKTRLFATTAAGAAIALAVTACGSDSADTEDTTAADRVVVTDAWVKAADSGMTAAFARVENTGGDDVRVVAASSPASAHTELHEMASNDSGGMTMREKDGGFAIAPGDTLAFSPGHDHIMLMELTDPVVAGGAVTVTLEFDDGSTTTTDAQVRDFAGNQENYGADGEPVMGAAHGG
ncbi:copper chaperone PCu(A)C [Rhodococcus rhodnii]|uniref:Copper chaperone PCu(A)C n=2 Tax=Rhodococcus rhodnii TaxID=38312 RepID=R7WUS3_9NOCA|nr:copper chaperone PCu(A)C [Rhodococcus rhodnii]EOM77879.1 hypothetical protein Rrhod_0772 [Rhodococcus rhodnii LMG 5362]TXG88948.1 copper chaperone PCu(A)C [Rhodococcus rhodnii]